MIKIKATYRSGRGEAECDCCSNNPDRCVLILTYGKMDDAEEAEKRLYRELYSQEMDQQNLRYRKKSNYGRIWTIEEWRKSVRHRPVENVFKIGNKKHYISAADLYDAYREFYRWRRENYGDIIVFVSAVIYTGCVPHIHERCVISWIDDDGVRHTDIDGAMERAGIGLPFPESNENIYNNRKLLFDKICRGKWLDLVAEKLKNYPDLELVRPDSAYKMRIGIDREFRLAHGYERAMQNAAGRANKKMYELTEKIEELEEEREMLVGEIDAKCAAPDDMEKYEERLRVVTGKIKEIKKRKEKAEEKYESIRKTMGY